MGKKLYVGNLSFETTGEDLRAFVTQVAECVSANVITDRDTGRSRGFGFVEMRSEGDAQTAIAKLNGAELKGRKLTVNEARDQSGRGGDRPRGGPGRR
jgi:RNA recognition motif-containing protein